MTCSDASGEINHVVHITEWLRAKLCEHLLAKVLPDLQKVAILGHSRGGKVAFGVALGLSQTPLLVPYAAILGIDPVDGTSPENQTPPPNLTYEEHSFPGNISTLLNGSGLGPIKSNCLATPYAPEGVKHVEFFRECSSPAYHFVAVDYGHMDFLDDKTCRMRGMISYCMCKSGTSREPMRRFSGGIIVAFLNAWVSFWMNCYKLDLEDESSKRKVLKLVVGVEEPVRSRERTGKTIVASKEEKKLVEKAALTNNEKNMKLKMERKIWRPSLRRLGMPRTWEKNQFWLKSI
ncbi:hypothetical protein SUGI_1148440 [Cryptomeria japonica]|nr:hypothetical protein SUGI_1148440 [Cryptomeria japonica]